MIIIIVFKEPKSGVRACLAHLPGVNLMYVAEIIPPAATAVEVFESKYVEEALDTNRFIPTDGNSKDIECGMLKGHIQRASFEGLRKDVDYSVKVSTVVNGKTISEVCEDIEEEHEGKLEETDEIEDVTNENKAMK